jgi:hypothetical protein
MRPWFFKTMGPNKNEWKHERFNLRMIREVGIEANIDRLSKFLSYNKTSFDKDNLERLLRI